MNLRSKEYKAELRDRIAIAVINGVFANSTPDLVWAGDEELCKRAYDIADLLLREREDRYYRGEPKISSI